MALTRNEEQLIAYCKILEEMLDIFEGVRAYRDMPMDADARLAPLYAKKDEAGARCADSFAGFKVS